jgi:ankyrin repeat protein
MYSQPLPPRPSLAQLKRRAHELHTLYANGKQAAAARIIAHHPRFGSRSTQAALREVFALADAQLVVAREHGFQSWAALKYFVETKRRVARFKPHPGFGEAVEALVTGDLDRLRRLIASSPELVHARTNLEPPYHYFTGATLLHHVAWNPSRESPVPRNIVDVARLLLDHGAAVDAMTLGRNAGTTMGLVITSRMVSEADVSGPLIDLLVEYGAALDLGTSQSVIPDWGKRSVLDAALANHAPRAAEKLIELGAEPDVCAAAALGRMDLLEQFFTASGHLRVRPHRNGAQLSEADAIGLAFLFAYVNRRSAAVDFLLEKDGNWNMTGVNNGTALHRAAWDGDLAMVKRLVAKGADMSNRDNPFSSTPLSWAQHNKRQAVFDWMVANCAIDIHEAVGMNLRDHVEARLREDPSCVNRQIDNWEAPQSTPLYWAAWTSIQDIDGTHYWDVESRKELVRLLLDHGADPNIVAGDGYTPLDVARTAGAAGIVALLQARGAKSGRDL